MAFPVYQAVGIYEVITPFTVADGVSYICESIEGYEALIAEGIDIYSKFYQPHGIDQAIYLTDLKNNESIVTLLADGQSPLVLPTSYILSVPDTKAVSYHQTFISISLGALPDGLNLQPTILHLKEIVDNNLGVTTQVKPLVGPITDHVDFKAHGDLETARLSNIAYRNTPSRDLKDALARIVELEDRVSMLQNALINLA